MRTAIVRHFCAHRLKLLRGDRSEIVSKNAADLSRVLDKLPGTRLDTALVEFNSLANQVTTLREKGESDELKKAESEFKKARKKLSIAMMM